MIIATPSIPKRSVFKTFPSTRKRNAGVFKFPQFEKRFRDAPFSWRISVDGRPNHRHKDAQLNDEEFQCFLLRVKCKYD